MDALVGVETMIRRLPLLLILAALLLAPEWAVAQASGGSSVSIDLGGEDDLASAIEIILLLTVLTFGPAIVIMMTSFTRLIVVFFFLRSGLGTQQTPPNQVLIGLALFITLFIMAPTIERINTEAYQPFKNGDLAQLEALDIAGTEMKTFMVKQTRQNDLILFMDLGNVEPVASVDEIPMHVVIPAFIISELRIAFQIGFLVYLPFLVIDLVVASVLLSIGIMFLPPVLVSLPFKILVFVLADGWNLLVQSLIRSFVL
jgi:flagellar biosynthetic protein FliP